MSFIEIIWNDIGVTGRYLIVAASSIVGAWGVFKKINQSHKKFAQKEDCLNLQEQIDIIKRDYLLNDTFKKEIDNLNKTVSKFKEVLENGLATVNRNISELSDKQHEVEKDLIRVGSRGTVSNVGIKDLR